MLAALNQLFVQPSFIVAILTKLQAEEYSMFEGKGECCIRRRAVQRVLISIRLASWLTAEDPTDSYKILSENRNFGRASSKTLAM